MCWVGVEATFGEHRPSPQARKLLNSKEKLRGVTWAVEVVSWFSPRAVWRVLEPALGLVTVRLGVGGLWHSGVGGEGRAGIL